MAKKLYPEENIQLIAEAIRTKNNLETKYTVAEMPQAILDIPTGSDEVSPFIISGDHCDNNGVWHKPADWDDIESIDLTDKHECYLLYACHLTQNSFCSLRVYGGGTITWSYGHVNNGVFTKHDSCTEKTISSGGYIRLYLLNFDDDYLVIKITSTSYLSQVFTASWAATSDFNYAAGAAYNTALMRYGRLYRGTNLSFLSFSLESDYMIDFGEYYLNTTTTVTVSSAYTGNYSLLRVRYKGTTDFSKLKITSFGAMFSNCFMLSDIENKVLDMTNWCKAHTTTLASMFYLCYSLSAKLIVDGWDVSNVTSTSGMFYNCRGVTSIKGLDSWNALSKCTTISNMFYWCLNLDQDLDLSNWMLGLDVALTTLSGAFYYTAKIRKINLNNANLSNCTSLANTFYGSGVKEIEWSTNFTPPSSKCIDYTSCFSYMYGLADLTLDGWDFSGATSGKLNYLFYYMYGTRTLNCINCVSNCITDSGSTIFTRYDYNLRYLDISWIDASYFTNTGFGSNAFRDCHLLVEFYPPQNISKSMNFTNNYNLSHDSLVRIMENLITVTTALTLTFGAMNLAKLSTDEKAIATSKGWKLA